MIEFACHTWAFNDLTLAEALGTIARLGFRHVDIGSGPGLNTARATANPRREAVEIHDDLEAYNLKVSDLYLMLPRISAADDEKRQKDLDIFKALMPFAEALGAPGVTVSPGVAVPFDADARPRAVEALREMLTLAKAVGLRLSIEPHVDSLAAKPADALSLLDDVPGLEITLDWAHMICQNVHYDDVLKLLPNTRHVQLRQAARNKLQTPFEKGALDLPRIMNDLQTIDYKGVVCIEYMNMPGWHGMMTVNAPREITRLRDALREARDRKA